ncbi:MAG: COG1361 S-layer family protein [Euryarchaeota archaeon]|nr:COG1361 S-layer family protein [Euryarchaeota archaeon]
MHNRTTIRPVLLLGMITLIAITAIATAPICCAAPDNGNTDIKIAVNELDPQPVEPGRDLVLSVTLGNYGRGVAEHAVLTIMPDSPIVLKNENDRIMRYDRIIGYGAHFETYILYIDPAAVSGNYEIELGATWTDDGQHREQNLTVPVVVRGEPKLVISDITVEPEIIKPEDTFDLSFRVSNKGSGTASTVQVTAALENLSFVPMGADTKIIKRLDPNASEQLSYRIATSDSAKVTSYAIPITMSCNDESGGNVTSQSFVGINVVGDADLCIASVKTNPENPATGDVMTLMLQIENSGHGDAESVKVTIDIPFEGTRTAFLGKIEADDDAPCIFNFRATESGDIPYRAVISYKDDIGDHKTTVELVLYVGDGGNGDLLIPALAAVAFIVVGVFYLRRKK